MDSLLTRAYFRQHCHQCGESYALTLYDILQEQRLATDWHNLQGRDIADPDTHHIMSAIPGDALRTLEEAWETIVSASREAGLELNVALAAEGQRPHHH